ncbi:hypothetical protein FACS1894188_01770 [Clostridia bacterium]|nr:hypothetical protein FACS1894188_01770 [Clostridia bacterium]
MEDPTDKPSAARINSAIEETEDPPTSVRNHLGGAEIKNEVLVQRTCVEVTEDVFGKMWNQVNVWGFWRAVKLVLWLCVPFVQVRLSLRIQLFLLVIEIWTALLISVFLDFFEDGESFHWVKVTVAAVPLAAGIEILTQLIVNVK